MSDMKEARQEYSFEHSAAPGAWMVVNAATGQHVRGSVFANIGSGFTYEVGRWDGKRQVIDRVRAETFKELSEAIADLQENYEP